MLAEFIYNEGRRKRPLLISQEQAKEELLATLRCGALKARGVRRDPDKRKPVSDTFQDIPTCDWMILTFGLSPPERGGRYVAFYEHNCFPWQHVVCSGATVRQLWPTAPGSAKPLSDREQAARIFLESWPIRQGLKDPYYGARAAANRHVAETCRCTEGAAKKSIEAFITDEINRLRTCRE